MPVCSPIPVLGLSAVQSRAFRILVGAYERRLVRTGYHPTVVRLHLHSIAHLGVWFPPHRHRCRRRLTLRPPGETRVEKVDLAPL